MDSDGFGWILMDIWMDGWLDGLGWMGGWIDAWVDGWVGRWMDGLGGWMLRIINIAVRVLCLDNFAIRLVSNAHFSAFSIGFRGAM